MGASGAGKSTITQLMMRFYQNYSGQLIIDKTEIKLLPLSDLRKQIAIVPQDILLFGGALKKIYHMENQMPVNQEIQKAAEQANAHHLFRIPRAYETLVGDRGIQLSEDKDKELP